MSHEKETESWLALDKRPRKRAFELTAQGLVERSVREEGGPRCMFELTEVVGGGDLWWTLGFEASGAAETLEPSLRACVGRLLERPLPDGIKLPSKTSMSYTLARSTLIPGTGRSSASSSSCAAEKAAGGGTLMADRRKNTGRSSGYHPQDSRVGHHSMI